MAWEDIATQYGPWYDVASNTRFRAVARLQLNAGVYNDDGTRPYRVVPGFENNVPVTGTTATVNIDGREFQESMDVLAGVHTFADAVTSKNAAFGTITGTVRIYYTSYSGVLRESAIDYSFQTELEYRVTAYDAGRNAHKCIMWAYDSGGKRQPIKIKGY